MIKAPHLLLALAAFGGAFAGSRRAAAQADVNPPLPNVMLAVDSSGSMEYKSSSSAFPACTGPTSEKSRWIELVEVLTGGIQNYSCDAVDRSSNAFRTEYSLSGTVPADYQYVNRYHRPVSGTCTPGPGTLPANAYDFPVDAIRFHELNNPALLCTNFTQSSDGLLDTFLTRVRFGLTTFDSHVHAGRGVTPPGTTPNYATGVEGTWSYYLGSPSQGRPVGCNVPYDQEVGVRSAAAPPWEGRMVAFGDPSSGSTAITQKNQQIQQILLALRPYGATPIAGMLDDVRSFLWSDTSIDPLVAGQDFGPYRDPYIVGGCRKNFVILLSDGEPNLDLRPYCEGAPSPGCPYPKPELTASNLFRPLDPNNRTEVFVIGFAVSQVTLQDLTPVNCKTLTDLDLTDPMGLCMQNPTERGLQACCTLNRIAFEGGTTRAQFADDMDQLRSAMSSVLSKIASSTTSRTVPVIASGSASGGGTAAGYRFFSSFEPQQFQLWSGVIERQRFECKKVNGVLVPTAKPVDPLEGDDFAANVNSPGGAPRLFQTVVAANVGGRFSTRSIRPGLAADDGAGTYSGTVQTGGASTLVPLVPADAMQITGTTCPGLTAALCRDRYLKWDLGLSNGTTNHRCQTPGSATCSLVGDVYHSTPKLVGRPSELLRDESYRLFAAKKAKRALVMYTSTNDGFLHAFKVAPGDPDPAVDPFLVDSRTNNELWAFIPPAVLPSIPSQYPSTHQLLLDGVPVVKDVVAFCPAGTCALNTDRFRFDRGISDTSTVTWRTVLVQAFGGSRGGYFALDVTDPVVNTGGTEGPRFLWQITEDDIGNPLFGLTGSTPLITTLFFGNAGAEKEVAVAVLPGGQGGPATAANCNRGNTTPSPMPSGYPARTQVPCYPALGIGGRSLTIVRLDTGEIVRTFRRDDAEVPAALRPRVTEVPLDSPITGQPAAFPGDVGAIADRVFVGDQDGTLWRADLSAADPANWTMRLFFDPYWDKGPQEGQPIQTDPVLSVDTVGNVTVAFATGDQEVLTAPAAMINRIVSLTEKLTTGVTPAFQANVNWYQTLTAGERAAGPLSLFNGALFFSSFRPEPATSTEVCKPGTSRVWGMDYLVPNSTALSDGGKPRMPADQSTNPTLVQFIDNTSSLFSDKAVIFGVSVAQLPTCTEEGPPEADSFLGYGTRTAVTTVQPGTFQLVMHTGNNGTAVAGGRSNVLSLNLPAPSNTPRIDSWAAIIE